MTDLSIIEFFQDRKEAWLKKNVKVSMNEYEVKEKEAECNDAFSLEQWLPNAAKRAGQISISTHPCTFSHPSSRKNKNGYATSVIASSPQKNDGYLRSGNVVVEADALGNAAALDVYKFLTLKMSDGENLLMHIENESDLATELLKITSVSYEELREGFLAMIQSDANNVTSSKIKQVYFPVGDDYHQLSILSASGIMFELRKRVDVIRFSDETKEARACEKANEIYSAGYRQFVNLTTIGYGGTKPQNISVLNNQNGGKVHLLSSEPPKLETRDIQFPRLDFFSQSFNYYQCKDLFYSLQKIFLRYDNNVKLRAKRDEHYQEIIDRIINKMWLVRSVSQSQFNVEANQLNKAQKTWLCDEHKLQREEEGDWLDDLTKDIASFIFNGYEKVLGKKAFMFSDGEFTHIHKQVIKSKEALR